MRGFSISWRISFVLDFVGENLFEMVLSLNDVLPSSLHGSSFCGGLPLLPVKTWSGTRTNAPWDR